MDSIINIIINNFDISYCITVNILTYIIITVLINANHKDISRVLKRVILIVAIIVVAIVYYNIGVDNKVLVNSAILAPVSWSWVIKPIVTKLGYDYKQIDKAFN